ncbi:MAG: winged helix-turn-helix domain-containing protein [Candidatus Nitrosocaldus sp.]|nr:winged helix-turn-helix domain-containing protein [Candidatus Nitrosocaldus sp.]MDW7999478.1 winged helix-turn-helix domain-containing protein [Candidatus Nitrosocaldus sp.]
MNGQVSDADVRKGYMYEIDTVRVFEIMLKLFSNSVEMNILRVLSIKDGPCSLRGLARAVGIHHTNLVKYCVKLVDAGVVEWEQVGRTRVIRLSSEYAFMRRLFRH